MAATGAETALGYVVSAVAALAALIFIHELGHFLVAKVVGVGVERFSLGFGCAPTPLRFIFTAPSTRLLAELPLVMIPTALVPYSIITHILSLRSLRASRQAVGTPAPAGAA